MLILKIYFPTAILVLLAELCWMWLRQLYSNTEYVITCGLLLLASQFLTRASCADRNLVPAKHAQ